MIAGMMAAQMRQAVAASTFPEVRSAQVVATSGSAASLTVNYTASAGDLIIVNFGMRASAFSVPGLSEGDWSLLDGAGAQNGSSVSSFIWTKVVSASGSLTITPSSSLNCAAVVVVVKAGTHQGVIESVTSTGSGSPNPAQLTPSWGSAKALWLAMYSQANGTTASAYPLPDHNMYARSLATSSGCSAGLCAQSLEADSLDPGAFTLSATAAYVGRMVGVRPA